MPMYKGYAPFFEGDKGDRRVTGYHDLKPVIVALSRTKTDKRAGIVDERRWNLAKFSREFWSFPRVKPSFIGNLALNSRENLTVFGILFTGSYVVMFNYGRIKDKRHR